MKWVVIWFVLNSWMVPCEPMGPQIDEYGRKTEPMFITAQACFEEERTRMTKEFESFDAAYKFLSYARADCSECSYFEIISIERESSLWFQDSEEIVWSDPPDYKFEWINDDATSNSITFPVLGSESSMTWRQDSDGNYILEE